MTAVLILAGLVLLFAGGELLVRGASRLAAAAGISPLMVGLTVVAFATSAPELAVTLQSSAGGRADLVIGNVIGSNISNVLLILGASALVAPLFVQQKLIRIDVPIMIGVSALVMAIGQDGRVGPFEGLILIVLLVAYLVLTVLISRHETKAVLREYVAVYGTNRAAAIRHWLVNVGLVVFGVGLLVLGAQWLVEGAVTLASWFGLSELIVGLTIVAVGTSLPEFATSVIAAARGERDIAVGNVVGSNIFNLLFVLGLTASVSPTGVTVAPPVLAFDLPVLVGVAVACLPVFFRGHQIARWEGALFIGYYAAYVAYLFLNATHHASIDVFNVVMLWFVIPLTVVTLIVITIREVRRNGVPPVS